VLLLLLEMRGIADDVMKPYVIRHWRTDRCWLVRCRRKCADALQLQLQGG
jgi:hypothetical protein